MASLERFVIGLIALPLSACFNPPTVMESEDGSTGEGTTASDSSGDVPTSTAPGVTSEVEDTSGGDVVCGDGIVDDTEACDDADMDAGDGCSATCEIETGYACTGEPSVCAIDCGDGIILGDEACDDANSIDGDGCTACAIDAGAECTGEPSVCTTEACGNGTIDLGESCDDGNSDAGDGCNGAGSCNPVRVLYMLGGADDDAAFRGSISSVVGSDTGFFDAQNNLPSDLILNEYDCVITHPDTGYFNPTVTGVLLVNYVNNGGTVVLGVGAGSNVNGLDGTMIMGTEYSPVSTGNTVGLMNQAEYSGDGSSAIHDGIVSYGTAIIDLGVGTQGAGVEDATYDDGATSVAHRPDFKVVYINGTGRSDHFASGDWGELYANACSVGFTM